MAFFYCVLELCIFFFENIWRATEIQIAILNNFEEHYRILTCSKAESTVKRSNGVPHSVSDKLQVGKRELELEFYLNFKIY